MKIQILFCWLCVVCLPLCGAAAEGAAPAEPTAAVEGREVVAQVNGESLYLDELELRLGRMHGSVEPTQRDDFDPDRLVFKAVNDMLIGQEARALGLHEQQPTKGKVERFRTDLMLRTLEWEEIGERARASDDEIRKSFEELYEQVTLRVVTLAEQRQAQALIEEIEAGGDMEQLARERSIDPFAIRGGRLEETPRRDLLPEIAELAFSIEPGRLGGPVRTDVGWSVLRVESRKAADEATFDELREMIRDVVQNIKATRLREELSTKIREKFPVVIDEEQVQRIVPQSSPEGRLLPLVEAPTQQLVRIGESRTILASAYAAALKKRWKRVRNLEAATAAAPIILKKLIEEGLRRAEAESRDYASRPEFQREVRDYETQLLIPKYLQQVVASRIQLSKEEMQAYYKEHVDEFRMPPRLRLGQITVATMEEAERTATLLRQGTDLAWLAERHSTDGFKSAGGDRGWMTPTPGTPDFNAALLEAEIGDVLDPFGGLENYVVIKVTGREEQGSYPFERVSGNVREALFSSRMRSALGTFLDTLRARSEIEINEELLQSMLVSGSVEEPAVQAGAGGHGH